MEYHEEALEFISYHYFKVKNKNHGIYDNITDVMFSVTQFPFFGMPVISFLTATCIYPRIVHYVEQYLLYLQDHGNLPLLSVSTILYASFVTTNIFFSVLLIILHISSISELIIYGDEVLEDEDHYLPYLYAGFSSFAVAVLFTCSIFICIYKVRRVRNATPPVGPTYLHIFVIGTILSVNVIYILCCFAPMMILAFINSPLVTFSIYSIILITFATFFYIFFSYMCGIVIKRRQNNERMLTVRELRRLVLLSLLLAIPIVATLVYALGLIIIFVSSILFLGGFNSNQSLQAILLSLLLGFISFAILKPAYNTVQTRVGLVNNNVNNEETQSNDAA